MPNTIDPGFGFLLLAAPWAIGVVMLVLNGLWWIITGKELF